MPISFDIKEYCEYFGIDLNSIINYQKSFTNRLKITNWPD